MLKDLIKGNFNILKKEKETNSDEFKFKFKDDIKFEIKKVKEIK